MLYELLNFIGESGPITLFLLIIILLYRRKNTTLLVLFIIFQIVNNIINLLLKLLFKQSRPLNSPHSIKEYIFKANEYGMPSGHAQNIISQTLFIIYYFNNNFLTFFSLIQSFITLAQRYYGNFHTLMQILIGSLVGFIMTFLFFYSFK